jgi:hypothetical protein
MPRSVPPLQLAGADPDKNKKKETKMKATKKALLHNLAVISKAVDSTSSKLQKWVMEVVESGFTYPEIRKEFYTTYEYEGASKNSFNVLLVRARNNVASQVHNDLLGIGKLKKPAILKALDWTPPGTGPDEKAVVTKAVTSLKSAGRSLAALTAAQQKSALVQCGFATKDAATIAAKLTALVATL